MLGGGVQHGFLRAQSGDQLGGHGLHEVAGAASGECVLFTFDAVVVGDDEDACVTGLADAAERLPTTLQEWIDFALADLLSQQRQEIEAVDVGKLGAHEPDISAEATGEFEG